MLSLFTGLSAPVIQAAATILLIESFTMWFRAFNAVNVVGVLRSGGDTVFSLKLDVGSMWLIGVPLCAAAVFLFNLPHGACVRVHDGRGDRENSSLASRA